MYVLHAVGSSGTRWWPFHVRTGMVLSSMMCWLFILTRLIQ